MNEQINRSDWLTFFSRFSQENQGRLVSMEVVGQELGADLAAETIPLIAVDFDPRPGTIFITLGQDRETFTHTIAAPKAIWVERADHAKAVALEVIAEDDSRTILCFKD